jgi:hypothetical protein
LEQRVLQDQQVLRQQGGMVVIQYSLLLPLPEAVVVAQEIILLNPARRMVEMVDQVVVLLVMDRMLGLVIPPQHLPRKDTMVVVVLVLMVVRGVVVLVLLDRLIRGLIIAVVLAVLAQQTQSLALLLLMA